MDGGSFQRVNVDPERDSWLQFGEPPVEDEHELLTDGEAADALYREVTALRRTVDDLLPPRGLMFCDEAAGGARVEARAPGLDGALTAYGTTQLEAMRLLHARLHYLMDLTEDGMRGLEG